MQVLALLFTGAGLPASAFVLLVLHPQQVAFYKHDRKMNRPADFLWSVLAEGGQAEPSNKEAQVRSPAPDLFGELRNITGLGLPANAFPLLGLQK
jgi:hypothetical protein